MEFTVGQIAELLGGYVEGNTAGKVRELAKIEDAGPGTLAFLSNNKYEHFLYTTLATAVIVAKSLVLKQPVAAALIRVDDPYTSFSTLLEEYQKAVAAMVTGVEEPAYLGANTTIGEQHYRGAFSYIGKNCQLGQHVKIYPQAYIGDNVSIGDHSIVYAGAKIYSGTVIGSHCAIHAGAVLGSAGFGFAPQPDGTYRDIPQTGNVVLEDRVRIGANTTIDCATLGSTIIREGSKIDNLVQIAHNVEIGRHTAVAAQTGISGSTKIGNYCIIAGQVGIVGHISLADKTTIGAQSGISKSITQSGTFLQGSPAFDYKQNLRALAVFRRLPEIQKQLDELKAKI
jgi:UDP-3-O-[3-hydroxymyristoyl] glucosamine N-acyltransferase